MRNSKDLLKILLASDLHLGHLENDPIRGEDSFNAFEEILKNAKDQKVDMILLGGNLFDKNKPSRRTIWKAMKLLRTYCMGEGEIKFRVVSEQEQNFPDSFGGVNFEDPNYNISIPVFSIHGSNDDPSGGGGMCAQEVLGMANLINYFGKSESTDDISVYPILFEKGKTRFALYGLGWIRDERLHATFQERKVQFFRPPGDNDDWFSLLMLHQNRFSHDRKSCIDETMLENFLDFVLWGHEHECSIKPQRSTARDFFISQPGAPIVTSLGEGEEKQKFVGILEIKQKEFRLREIPLNSTRPFVTESFELNSNGPLGSKGRGPPGLDTESVRHVGDYLVNKIEELIVKAKELPSGKEMLPLVRLRVEYEGDVALPNPYRISAMFVGKIANPNEVIVMRRRRATPPSRRRREGTVRGEEVEEEMEEMDVELEEENRIHCDRSIEPKIGDVIESFIEREMDGDLCIHDKKDLNAALVEFVDKMDARSFDKCIRKSITSASECVRQRKEDNCPTNKEAVMGILASWRSSGRRDILENNDGEPTTAPLVDGSPESPPRERIPRPKPKLSSREEIERERPKKSSEPRKRKVAKPTPPLRKTRRAAPCGLDIVCSSLSSQSSQQSPKLNVARAKRKRVQPVLPSPQTCSKKRRSSFIAKPSFGDWDAQESLMDSDIQRSQEWGRRKG